MDVLGPDRPRQAQARDFPWREEHVISHYLSNGQRDFASSAQTRADHYEVQVDDGYATEAQRVLSTMPAS